MIKFIYITTRNGFTEIFVRADARVFNHDHDIITVYKIIRL